MKNILNLTLQRSNAPTLRCIRGLQALNRNKFENNVVGIRATANAWVQVFSNDFDNFDFDVAINGTTSDLTDNNFASGTAGNQFDNTGSNANNNLCNRYNGNIVGTNIVGKNVGFTFHEEDYATDFHDLFIEGTAATLGEIPIFAGGNNGAAVWNYFTAAKTENIKSSTVQPNNNTAHFFYFHPNPMLNPQVKPKCALNDVCMPHSNFTNIQTGGPPFDECIFPEGPQAPCQTKPCLDAVRAQIVQKTAQYAANPTTELAAELQTLTTERERITSFLISEYITLNYWLAIETLLNEDMNPFNRRRLVGAKLEQNQFAAASALLQSFPQSTTDDQNFIQVQSINTARLADPAFVLSSAQEATLLSIAEAPSPEAGYAQSLLGILTGQTFMPKVPDLGGERNAPSLSVQTTLPDLLQVSPNPVSNLLEVRIKQPVSKSSAQTLDLHDLVTGILMRSIQIAEESTLFISVEDLSEGIYLLTLRGQGGTIARKKIAVQH